MQDQFIYRCVCCGEPTDGKYYAELRDFVTDWNIGGRIVHVYHRGKSVVPINLCRYCYEGLKYKAENPEVL